jgi:hypothetical protein
VDLPAALLAHLQDLTASIGQDDQDVDNTLAVLTAALHSTATTYCGFQLTLVQNQWPVTLTAFTDGHGADGHDADGHDADRHDADGHDADGHDIPVGTSLRLPLVLVSPAVDPESRVVFFAVTPGAFTDLAADLSYALGGIPVDLALPAVNGVDQRGTRADGQRRVIELDVDLPPRSRVSGLAGLAELTILNRAIGILVAQGHDIEHAHQVLRRDAAAAGVEPHVYAARILRR